MTFAPPSIRLRFRRWNRQGMIRWNRFLTKSNVTLGADKVRIFFATINLQIQRAAVIQRLGDVTTVGAAT